jgi:metal-responsive CopG/Arc/MetJ family transcriptional regulator
MPLDLARSGAIPPVNRRYDSGMKRVAKVAISLPDELLAAVDEECRLRGTSRSQYFRTAVELQLRNGGDASPIETYIRGYTDHPESPEEIEHARRSAESLFASDPWP